MGVFADFYKYLLNMPNRLTEQFFDLLCPTTLMMSYRMDGP